ncbi:FluG domain protein [Aspergillus ellipticus CBS 707.79]|uniref:FluG domain protein n=1 Tax=Aspergillus ellipticus CBS 707.79 TaxID=1448320 RepID=A0A319E745_9EURO|nr:FluG domain protein [Aspergillus ellipticus CBS 707.79]
MDKRQGKVSSKIDWNQFVQEPDIEVKSSFAATTQQNIILVHRNFERFVHNLKPQEYKYWLQNINLRVIEGFFRWYLENHAVVHQSGFLVFARYFRMYWCEEMGQIFDYDLRRRMTMLVCTTLTDEYELELGGKTQPSMNIDDLLYTTHHLVGITNVWFPTVRCRQQHSTLRKMMTSTSARPGTLVESSGYMRQNDALLWKDIELYMVKHPEHPTCKVLLMRVKHRLNKGRRNRGVAPVYTYTERNDNLGLCVIQDILEYAFLDNAFASQHIKSPRDIWLYTDIPGHRQSTPIHFKDSVKNIPILRRAVKDSEGNWITHPTKALTYARAQEDEIRTSRSAGFKEPGSLYKYRKGAAANLRHLDEHSRNQVMGHRRGGAFAYYVQIRDDTQSAFMETPARDALLKLSSNASLTRDASAPQELSKQEKINIELNPELKDLRRKCAELRRDIISKYHQIQKAKDSEQFQQLKHLQRQVRATRKRLSTQTMKVRYTEFFHTVGNQIIDHNFRGEPLKFEFNQNQVIPERTTIAQLEFKNRNADTVDDTELLEDRIKSLELRLQLHRLEIPKQLHTRISIDTAVSAELQAVAVTASLMCPVCLGRTSLHPRARTYQYARKDTLQKHFATHNLSRSFFSGRSCDIPDCNKSLHSLTQYKHHQATEHGIEL